jgi:hypothetical protein
MWKLNRLIIKHKKRHLQKYKKAREVFYGFWVLHFVILSECQGSYEILRAEARVFIAMSQWVIIFILTVMRAAFSASFS